MEGVVRFMNSVLRCSALYVKLFMRHYTRKSKKSWNVADKRSSFSDRGIQAQEHAILPPSEFTEVSDLRMRSHTHFGWQYLMTIAALGIILFPGCSLLLLNRYDSIDCRWINKLYHQKQIAALRADKRGSHRLILLGGSAGVFGIDAELIESKLGVPTVNYATHAGPGLAFLLSNAKQILHAGDIAVLSIEYYLYADSRPIPEPMCWDYMITYQKSQVVNMGWGALEKLYSTPISEDADSALRLMKRLVRPETPIGAYGSAQMSVNGDIRVVSSQAQDLSPANFAATTDPSRVEVLREFLTWARANGIAVLATWPGAYLGSSADVESAAQKLRCLEELYRGLGVPVLGTIQDFSYPKTLFMDTHYHLSPGGRRLRTEKLIRLLRTRLGVAAAGDTSDATFVMMPMSAAVTPGNLFRNQPNMQFKCLTPTPSDNADLITIEDMIRMHKSGKQIYYDSGEIDSLLLQKGYWGDVAGAGTLSLADLVRQYGNHVFLMVASGTNRLETEPSQGLPDSFSRFLQGDDFRVGILGTGAYANIHNVHRDAVSANLFVRIGEMLGSGVKSPVQISLRSSSGTAQSNNESHLKVDYAELSSQRGLAIAVLDVEPGIVLQSATLPGARRDSAWKLNRMVPIANASGVTVEEVDLSRFNCTGHIAPHVQMSGKVAHVEFTGSQSVWGLRLYGDLAHRLGVLEIAYRFVKPGQVSAAVETNERGLMSYLPPYAPLVPTGEPQIIRIRFEFKSFPKKDDSEWVFAGLEGFQAGVTVDVERARILWRD